jgi:hypothetical protein
VALGQRKLGRKIDWALSSRCKKVKLCLDNAFAFIQGHPGNTQYDPGLQFTGRIPVAHEEEPCVMKLQQDV